MGRVYGRGKGISDSALPYKRTPPSWLQVNATEIEDQICKLAKKGLTPSQIGVVLRDSAGIAQVKSVLGKKLFRVLKKNGLAPEIPEDLYFLIKRSVQVRDLLRMASWRSEGGGGVVRGHVVAVARRRQPCLAHAAAAALVLGCVLAAFLYLSAHR
jgi:hypothetical protein